MSTTKPSVVGDFARFDRLAHEGATLNVVFLGGSLTWGARATDPQITSYRAQVGTKLRKFYPKAQFWFWDAAIGGTGSQLAVFRLERDVLARKPDLVFLDFTVNDGPFDPVTDNKLASYESLLRRILLESGAPVIQMLLAVKSDAAGTSKTRFLDPYHKKISEAYGTGLGDTVAYMRAKVLAGEADPDACWPYPPDVTHPGDKGYALYAETAWEAYQDSVRRCRMAHVPEKMLHPETYMTWQRQRLSQVGLPQGWKVGLPTPLGVAFDFYMSRWLYDVSVAEAGAAPMRIPFRGSVALLFGEVSSKSGKFLATIDGKPAEMPHAPGGVYTATFPSGYMFLMRVLSENLDPAREHVLEIVPQLEAGEELRIESLCSAGWAA
ncbi:MAG TPA: SGNH/GDSL hydrolase family protein [Candidatus Methylacidiphilales bacterium]|jgi:lysophospholipase L1-like esterase|nr:SGNH/GDSL hydrolase family protein [Candidatus Methylacidiphilales bacterium]